MVKDYAKRMFQNKPKIKQSSQHRGLCLFVLLLFSLFFTGFYYKEIQSAALRSAAQLARSGIV